MGGGAWPFLVGGVICLVNSVNERDPDLLIIARVSFHCSPAGFLEGLVLDFRHGKSGAITGL